MFVQPADKMMETVSDLVSRLPEDMAVTLISSHDMTQLTGLKNLGSRLNTMRPADILSDESFRSSSILIVFDDSHWCSRLSREEFEHLQNIVVDSEKVFLFTTSIGGSAGMDVVEGPSRYIMMLGRQPLGVLSLLRKHLQELLLEGPLGSRTRALCALQDEGATENKDHPAITYMKNIFAGRVFMSTLPMTYTRQCIHQRMSEDEELHYVHQEAKYLREADFRRMPEFLPKSKYEAAKKFAETLLTSHTRSRIIIHTDREHGPVFQSDRLIMAHGDEIGIPSGNTHNYFVIFLSPRPFQAARMLSHLPSNSVVHTFVFVWHRAKGVRKERPTVDEYFLGLADRQQKFFHGIHTALREAQSLPGKSLSGEHIDDSDVSSSSVSDDFFGGSATKTRTRSRIEKPIPKSFTKSSRNTLTRKGIPSTGTLHLVGWNQAAESGREKEDRLLPATEQVAQEVPIGDPGQEETQAPADVEMPQAPADVEMLSEEADHQASEQSLLDWDDCDFPSAASREAEAEYQELYVPVVKEEEVLERFSIIQPAQATTRTPSPPEVAEGFLTPLEDIPKRRFDDVARIIVKTRQWWKPEQLDTFEQALIRLDPRGARFDEHIEDILRKVDVM